MKKLNVLGLTYSQTQSGSYALVLAEEDGRRRIPIIIGSNEAQSIAIQLEGLHPPRPLTHDLFLSIATAFNIKITRVNIHKLEDGIFYSELICERGADRIKIDARTSDAVALALRFNSPIFTTDEILHQAGIVFEIDDNQSHFDAGEKKTDPNDFSKIELGELKDMLKEAVEAENYERASLIRDEIKLRE